jgi:drug/metabolite transporter (DMT)-like permease
MSPEKQSLTFLHIAVLFFGGTALFAQLINLNALDITVYRTAIAALALVVFLTLTKQAIRLRTLRDYFIVVLLGIVVGLHWVTYFAGMQMAGITIGIIAFFTYPVITVFLEPCFSKQLPHKRDIFIAAIVLIGIYMLVPEASFGNQVTLGIATGILSGFLFALRNILQKRYFLRYSGPQTMFYQTLIASLMLCAFVEVPIYSVSQSDVLLIGLVGVVFTAAPHALFAASLIHLSAKTAGLISCLQPLYASFFAFILLQEGVTVTTLLGGTLVISGAFFETYMVSKHNKRR